MGSRKIDSLEIRYQEMDGLGRWWVGCRICESKFLIHKKCTKCLNCWLVGLKDVGILVL